MFPILCVASQIDLRLLFSIHNYEHKTTYAFKQMCLCICFYYKNKFSLGLGSNLWLLDFIRNIKASH